MIRGDSSALGPHTRAIVVMGVSGCGKTSVGQALAQALGWRFVDADDHHPPENVRKMATGQALDDTDRAPWLERLNALLRHAQARGERVVLACSALRERYREVLRDRIDGVAFVHLSGSPELIRERLQARRHAYMPPTLLTSQFAALEAPQDALVVDVAAPIEAIVPAVAALLKRPGPAAVR